MKVRLLLAIAIMCIVFSPFVLIPYFDLREEPHAPFTIRGRYFGQGTGYTSNGIYSYDFRTSFNVKPNGDTSEYTYLNFPTTGVWAGSEPKKDGSIEVEITSPTGFTWDVVIKETASGKEYRTREQHTLEKRLYHWRLVEGATGQVVQHGDAHEYSDSQVIMSVRPQGPQSWPPKGYHFQSWPDGETPPPMPKPDGEK
jgi:hypothetical protein